MRARRAATALRVGGLTMGLALGVASCGDGAPILFPAAHELVVEFDVSLEGRAGEPVPDALTVQALDRHGNILPGLPVLLSVSDGGGSLEREQKTTDQAGRIRITSWTMGGTPGPNSLSIQAEGVDPVEVTVESGPGLPTEIAFVGQDLPESRVALTIEAPPGVLVRDRFGNPVPGESVAFAASGDGAVASSEVVSGLQGIAASPSWTLGSGAGRQFLFAEIPERGLQTAVGVDTYPGPAAIVDFDTPQDQRVEAGLFVPHAPVVLITDEWGNGIGGVAVSSVEVQAGGGQVEGWAQVTDEDGRAPVGRWWLGPSPGENRLVARSPGLSPGVLVVQAVSEDAEPQGRYFQVAHYHVNQANQSLQGDIPLVEGRPGALRVWITASEPAAPAPSARIQVFRGDTQVADVTAPPPTQTAPTSVAAAGTTPAWHVPLEGAWVGPDLRFEVEVDPDYEVGVVSRRTGVFPGTGPEPDFATVAPDLFRIRFVPLRDASSGVTGNVEPQTLDAFMDQTRRMLPLAADSATLGEPFVVNLFDGEGVVRVVLAEMRAAWAISDFQDHYFHGIFPANVPIRFAGVAYRPSNPSSPAPIGQTYDNLPAASFTVAHELGHNLGIGHAPCGNPAGVDPSYPHTGALIGPPGYDHVSGSLVSHTTRDLMSYCNPRWISDYNYELMLAWRLAAPWGTPAAVSGPARSGLLVWGRIGEAGATLEPALPVDAPPLMPDHPGPHHLRGFDAQGNELFSFSFQADEVEDDQVAEAHFAWVVPLDEGVRDQVDRLELDGPQGVSLQSSRAGPGLAPAPAAAAAARLEGDTVEWDPEVFPTAWVRDPDTGRVLGVVAAGTLDLSLWDRPVQVLLSDGVRGWIPGAAGLVRGSW